MSETPASNPAGHGDSSQYVTQDQVQQMLGLLNSLTQQVQHMQQAQQSWGQPPHPQQSHQNAPGQRLDDWQGERAVPGRGQRSGQARAPGMDVPIEPMQAVDPGDIPCGKEGDVKIGSDSLPEITKWSFKPTVANQEFASNKTNGFKRKVCGSKSGSGSLEGKWDRLDPITDHFTEGSLVTLLLHIDATRKITVPALIKSMSIDVDIDANAITGWTAEFEADGEWTYALAGGT